MVHCHYATGSAFVTKVRGEVFAHFHAVTVKCQVLCEIRLFGLPGRILCEPLMSKTMISMLFTCLAFFGHSEFGLSVYGSCCVP
jgi:hypothetical protein